MSTWITPSISRREMNCRGVTVALTVFTLSLLAGPAPHAAASDNTLEMRQVPDKAALARIPAGQTPRRIIIKFAEGTELFVQDGHLRSEKSIDPTPVANALASLGVSANDLQPLHTRPRAELQAERSRAQAASGRALADLSLYYVLDLPAGARAAAVLEQLSALPLVEFAEPEPIPAPPPVDLAPPTPDLTAQQGYRGAPPVGIGAFNTLTVPGGDGTGIRIVDIEYSWVLNHEDLELPASTNIDPSPALDPFPADQGNHGTAVLGELAGKANGYGVVGIAPGAQVNIAPAATVAFGYNLPRAISLATAALRPGDVILLEQQMSVCGSSSYGPVEWSQSVYDAIATATALGINVVEAAGNGAVDLDGAGCASLFNRTVRDSRAIIVGAGAPTTHERLWFSSYGSRLDVQGWGSSVTSSGYGDAFDPGDARQRYTYGFSGTSSASPIVAGSILALQGALKARGLRVATAEEMREALVSTGTAQSGTTHIGPLPRLADALNFLINRINPAARWRSWESFAGTMGSKPAECLATGASQTECFAPAATGGLGWWRYDGAALPSMAGLGGQAASPPTCAPTIGRLNCFVSTSGGRMAQIARQGTTWGSWTDLGGSIQGRPACVSTSPTSIECIALGTTGKLQWRSWNGTVWKAWKTVAPSVTFGAEPTCFGRAAGVDCVVADSSKRARHLRLGTAGTWSAPANLLGSVQRPASCIEAGAGFACFFMGGDQTLREIDYSGTAWGAWINHGGILTSAPACLRFGTQEVRCFSATSGNALQERRKVAQQWRDWTRLGGSIKPLRPSCIARNSTRIDCFAAGQNGRLNHLAYY